MKQLYYPEWSQPVLQMLFVGASSFALSASSPIALPKAGDDGGQRPETARRRLHLLRRQSVYRLYAGGIGAAYSPAKYGILGELTTGDKLVKANGLMESSTIAAILLGSMAGGISPTGTCWRR